MTSISVSELLPEDKRRLHELELQFIELERGNPNISYSDVNLGLSEMDKRLDDLDRLVQSEPSHRREDCRRRLQHLRNSHQHIKNSLENWYRRRSKNNIEIQRRELFGNADLEGGVPTESEMAENSSLLKSTRMVNDYIATGQETLSNLVGQKERLKAVQRKVFDILNYLGLSNNIMKSVEKRDVVDKWIVYAGMLIVILLLGFIYFFLFRKR
jgi:Golgi SNAP receptor complex protein 2